jgi:hypothetical protein
MANGLEVYNDYGTIQIIESYNNYGLLQKGNLAFSVIGNEAINPTYRYYANLTINCSSSAIVCVKSSNIPIVNGTGQYLVNYTFSQYSGSSYTITFFGGVGFDPYPTHSVDYYVFDKLSSINITDNYGIVSYKPDGTQAFNSNMKILKIIGVYNTESNAVTVPSGKIYAFLISSTKYKEDTSFLNNYDSTYDTYRVTKSKSGIYNNGTTINTGMQLTQSITNNYPIGTPEIHLSYGQPQYWLIDVTNY